MIGGPHPPQADAATLGYESGAWLSTAKGEVQSLIRLAAQTQSHKAISVFGAAACIGALIALLAHTAADRPQDLILLGGLLVLTYIGEATYQHRRRLRPVANHDQKATTPQTRGPNFCLIRRGRAADR